MEITILSDLHGNYPQLEGGDLLIVGGDWTKRDTEPECFKFFDWVHAQNYKKKIVIAGNHDNRAQREHYKGPVGVMCDSFTYLCDSGTEFEWFETEDTKFGPKHLQGNRTLKLKIWASPWTKTFDGMNPHCKAFTVDTEEELVEKWNLIPDDIDILVTHSPPYGILDETTFGESVGSRSLLKRINEIQPMAVFFGHIHEAYGIEDMRKWMTSPIYVNASHVNELYKPVNKPIRVIL